MAKYERIGMYAAVSSPYLESDRRICLTFWYNLYVSILFSNLMQVGRYCRDPQMTRKHGSWNTTNFYSSNIFIAF
jgi:hypothetical protein